MLMKSKNAKVFYFCRTEYDRTFVWFGNAADPHIHRTMRYGSVRNNYYGKPHTSFLICGNTYIRMWGIT
jgi:hypothetical protein